MDVNPQDVIQILAERLASEIIQSATQAAALRTLMTPPKDDGIPTTQESGES